MVEEDVNPDFWMVLRDSDVSDAGAAVWPDFFFFFFVYLGH
jgi:hypothetical protein